MTCAAWLTRHDNRGIGFVYPMHQLILHDSNPRFQQGQMNMRRAVPRGRRNPISKDLYITGEKERKKEAVCRSNAEVGGGRVIGRFHPVHTDYYVQKIRGKLKPEETITFSMAHSSWR
jgi:hypothetical protein